MGCCGCSNQSSALTAGIFGLIQSLIGLISYSYFLDLYDSRQEVNRDRSDESIFLLYETRNEANVLQILLALVSISHAAWLISSIILLIGYCTDSPCCARQWVAITSFIIIGDILLPVVVISITISEYSEVANSFSELIESSGVTSSSLDGEIDRVRGKLFNLMGEEIVHLGAKASLDVHQYYILLILSFTKGSLITIITNICLTVFTNRRARELSIRTGHVLTAFPVVMGPQQPTGLQLNQQIHVISSNVFPGNQMQQYPHAEPPVGFHSTPSGFVNPHFRIEAQPQLDEPEEAEPKNENQTIDRAHLINV